MRAAAVFPRQREVKVIERPEPRLEGPREVKVRILEVGVCGTDKDITAFLLGTAPAGSDYLVLGHESLGVVEEAGPDVTRVKRGDLVVGIVRHPCGAPVCSPCRRGHQDFCVTGGYQERGIKDMHGFMTDFVIDHEPYLHVVPARLREVAVLIEPLTIAEKVFLQLGEIQRRLPWRRERNRALVLGAGPVGLLGAMGLMEAGFETWVYSREAESDPRAAIARSIGATYVCSESEPMERFASRAGGMDVVYEAIGAAQAAFDALRLLGPNGVFVFTGVPRRGEGVRLEVGTLFPNLVLQNQIVMGTVNAGPDAFDAAVRDLGAFLERWPDAVRALITGRYPLEGFVEAVSGNSGGIKNVIVL